MGCIYTDTDSSREWGSLTGGERLEGNTRSSQPLDLESVSSGAFLLPPSAEVDAKLLVKDGTRFE